MKVPYQALPGSVLYQQRAWLNSARAARLRVVADDLLAGPLAEVFGRWCVQVGAFGGDSLCAHAGTLHRVVCGSTPKSGEAIRCEADRLPIATDVADAVILAHALEFARSPHQLVREADRILSDRGTLFVLGHSPYSPTALLQRVGLGGSALPPSARCVGAGRLSDWLELLDFEVTRITRYGSAWPWRRPREDSLLNRWADTYLLVARKRVVPLTRAGSPVRLRPVAKKSPAAVAAGARRHQDPAS
jgi:SAM-dependent methyltransferase